MTNVRLAPRWQRTLMLSVATLLAVLAPLTAADEASDLSKVTPEVLSKEQRGEASGMIARDIRRRTPKVNARNRHFPSWLIA